MSNKDFRGYIEDMLEYCARIQRYSNGLTFETFLEDDMRQSSIIRCLEVIGEASKHIPKDVRDIYPEIAWKTMAGMRDYLIHDYHGVNTSLVWKTIQFDIPTLIKDLNKILRDYQ